LQFGHLFNPEHFGHSGIVKVRDRKFFCFHVQGLKQLSLEKGQDQFDQLILLCNQGTEEIKYLLEEVDSRLAFDRMQEHIADVAGYLGTCDQRPRPIELKIYVLNALNKAN
jgi:hypothetical protein